MQADFWEVGRFVSRGTPNLPQPPVKESLVDKAVDRFDDTSPFDRIRHVDDRGECWYARELMALVEYARWDAFAAVVERAMASLSIVQGPDSVASNFLHVRNRERTGITGNAASDYRLTRFGAYLTAMAGDDTKPRIAEARIYFATKTREAELRPAPQPQFQIPQSYAEALELAARQAREIEEQRRELDWAIPRAQYADRFVDGASDASLIRDVAKQLKIGERQLRVWLVCRGLVYQDPHGEWKPRAQLGPRRHWFVLRDQPEAPRLHNGQLRTTLYVTPAGKTGIANLLKQHPVEGAA